MRELLSRLLERLAGLSSACSHPRLSMNGMHQGTAMCEYRCTECGKTMVYDDFAGDTYVWDSDTHTFERTVGGPP